MRVLVTGASGFVGSWLTKYLVDQGLEVKILNRSAQAPKEPVLYSNPPSRSSSALLPVVE